MVEIYEHFFHLAKASWFVPDCIFRVRSSGTCPLRAWADKIPVIFWTYQRCDDINMDILESSLKTFWRARAGRDASFHFRISICGRRKQRLEKGLRKRLVLREWRLAGRNSSYVSAFLIIAYFLTRVIVNNWLLFWKRNRERKLDTFWDSSPFSSTKDDSLGYTKEQRFEHLRDADID
jgi:hypothetical protein